MIVGMGTLYREYADAVRRLYRALMELERAATVLELRPLAGREWFELLRQKLLPQLSDDAFLVVAVVGGTNIGKSVIFNHIAGSKASATSPLASGTKHPVCLVPPGFAESHDLKTIFEGFALTPWRGGDEALEDRPEHRLYWKEDASVPENLVLLDTPDIDSDARVNWQRADHVRRAADVLIAVLTQQKYNDAAVKQFFRRAESEDKEILVVFNQCELPEDDRYWPLWLGTFTSETGAHPELVYVVPNDRKRAEANRLPFFERRWPLEKALREAGEGDGRKEEERDLGRELSRLRFAEIKVRSLRGALKQVLEPETGGPRYLAEVKNRALEFASASARLTSEGVVKVRDWPAVPNSVLVSEIRQWWKGEQEGWARGVHRFYDAVGTGLVWPLRAARDYVRGKPTPPLEAYRRQEWRVVLQVVEELFEKLSWMSESGSALLKPHFEEILAGSSRSELLERLKQSHEEADLAEELREVVELKMRAFRASSPETYRFYKQLNQISAAVRPAISVALFTLGAGPAGELVAPLASHVAAHSLVTIAADFAGGTATAVAGETAVARAAGHGVGYLQAKFQDLQTAFAARRVEWLVQLLKTHLLRGLPERLAEAAGVPETEAFREAAEAFETLAAKMADRG